MTGSLAKITHIVVSSAGEEEVEAQEEEEAEEGTTWIYSTDLSSQTFLIEINYWNDWPSLQNGSKKLSYLFR